MKVVKRLRKTYSYLRWTLKAPRHVGKFVRTLTSRGRPTVNDGVPRLAQNQIYEDLSAHGFAAVRASGFQLPDVEQAPLTGKARGMPFFNALPMHWEKLKPLICDVLKDPKVADAILRYFDGRPWLWNAALNFSEASDVVQDSQLWHFDYGDVKQLHIMLYFSDVDGECGPFTFFPADISDRVPRSSFEIERFTDAQLRDGFAIETSQAVRLTGQKRDLFFSDPGRTLHQGARCLKPRLVLFLTFTTPTPMSLGGSKTLRAAERRDLYAHYAASGARVFREEFFL
jgi:hypothetical protein